MASRQERLYNAFDAQLNLSHLEVVDESQNHSVPDGAESHFKVTAVAEDFEGMNRLSRHRCLNALAEDEFAAGMHALAIHTYTESEWRDRFGTAPMSPPCAKVTT